MTLLEATCPLPVDRYAEVVLGHGSGGRLSRDLLRDVFVPAFGDALAHQEDQSVLSLPPGRIALTTDAFVVSPPFFPGGDIGDLAVNGTVNDLAVGGAIPMYLSAAFVLETGFSIADLKRVVASMKRAAERAGVRVVTGDTKVVERGKGDGVYITTSGVGVVPSGRALSATRARPGDKVIVSGTLGDHGIAVLAAREGIQLETTLASDTAPLISLTEAVLAAAPDTRCMRDPTRGGLASALNEIAEASGVGIAIDERAIPLKEEVRGACELLGLDPLYVASEGKLVAIVPEESAAACMRALRGDPLGADAAVIGTVLADRAGTLVLRSVVGGQRIVPLLSGEQLPRIC